MPFLDLHGVSLRYREAGARRGGTPVVLVHGAGASSAVWLTLAHRLGRARRVLALDLPGHGRSGGAASSLADLRDALGGAAAALRLGRAVLVGHSLGALVVLEAARAWPDRVAGLGLVAAAARIAVDPATIEAIERGWARWPERLAEIAASPETPPEVARRGAGLACLSSQAQTLADYRALAATDLGPALPAIRAPALVVAGEHDPLVPPRQAAALAAGLGGGARLELLPRCGHLPMFEQPDRLADVLRAFLTDVP